MFDSPILWKGLVYAVLMMLAKCCVCSAVYFEHLWIRYSALPCGATTPPIADFPHIPALILSFAMVARGEIGFLIASLSSSSGTLILQPKTLSGVNGPEDQSLFLVIIWAVVLCTLLGPIGVGFMVRRMNGEGSSGECGSISRTKLGTWG